MATARPKSDKGRLELSEIKRLIEMIEKRPITDSHLEKREGSDGRAHGRGGADDDGATVTGGNGSVPGDE